MLQKLAEERALLVAERSTLATDTKRLQVRRQQAAVLTVLTVLTTAA
jgi:hypothetical protein